MVNPFSYFSVFLVGQDYVVGGALFCLFGFSFVLLVFGLGIIFTRY